MLEANAAAARLTTVLQCVAAVHCQEGFFLNVPMYSHSQQTTGAVPGGAALHKCTEAIADPAAVLPTGPVAAHSP